MTGPVIRTVSELTKTQLLIVNGQGIVRESTLDLSGRSVLPQLVESASTLKPITIDGRSYLFRSFLRRGRADVEDFRIAVLFDEIELHSTRLRAAVLPLVTGLSTVILLTSATFLLTNRLLRRLARLQSQVEQIAQGDFDVSVQSDANDELGRLGNAVTRMGRQLRSMWQTLNRQQGQKLLHQVAGGLAHQLRNSLTGARMAIELHQQQCSDDDETLAVALTQLEQTESHVRRLLLVASGKQESDQPQSVKHCLDEIRSTVDGTAKHLRIDLTWDVDQTLSQCQVIDGPTLHAAVTNLAINALEEAKKVKIVAKRIAEDRVQIDVVDDGPGPPKEVSSEIFEPFVTSKPEGLGLGLPLVARAAQRLGGEVKWSRRHDQTWFTLKIPVSSQ